MSRRRRAKAKIRAAKGYSGAYGYEPRPVTQKPPILKEFDSPLDFLEWSTNAPVVWQTQRSSITGSKSFTGTSSYEEAYNLAKYGWKEGLQYLGEQIEVAKKKKTVKIAPAKKIDVVGNRPHQGRAAAGDPQSMISNQKTDNKGRPIIRIAILLGYPYHTKQDSIIKWGAALATYIDKVEALGYSVEVELSKETYSSEHGTGTGPNVALSFPLKKAGDPVNLNSLVFWIAHPSALRRIGFAAMERLDIEQWYKNSYGYSKGFFREYDDDVILFKLDSAEKDIQANLDKIGRKIEKEIARREMDEEELEKIQAQEQQAEEEEKKRKEEEAKRREEERKKEQEEREERFKNPKKYYEKKKKEQKQQEKKRRKEEKKRERQRQKEAGMKFLGFLGNIIKMAFVAPVVLLFSPIILAVLLFNLITKPGQKLVWRIGKAAKKPIFRLPQPGDKKHDGNPDDPKPAPGG